MGARLIDGKAHAAAIRGEIAVEVAGHRGAGRRAPGLAVVLVGNNPASASYVKSKTKACAEAGFHSEQVDLAESVSEAELLDVIARLNAAPEVDGILVQLPLPRHINTERVLEAITPGKDVDGFHPVNAGRLATGQPALVPCTPMGVRELLLREGVETAGALAVIVGRSNIVGKPMAQLLLAQAPGGNATVCVCHSKTRDIGSIIRQADIVIAAVGRAHFVTADMVRPGAVVIDVGINRIEDAASPKGSRLVGDVDFEGVRGVASAITPVPGGVGPMTIAMLLANTLTAYRVREGIA
jgi:methylenetetrahydrofolate dehydrogenase (NADP+)/methenyltetrahydrofolate cyclohydrolase